MISDELKTIIDLLNQQGKITVLLLAMKIATITHQHRKMIILKRLQKGIILTNVPLRVSMMSQGMIVSKMERRFI